MVFAVIRSARVSSFRSDNYNERQKQPLNTLQWKFSLLSFLNGFYFLMFCYGII